MIQNSALGKIVTEKDKQLWARAMMIILEVAGYLHDNYPKHHVGYECHSICRALSMFIPELTVIDGHFVGLKSKKIEGGHEFEIRNCSHSWLLTPDKAIVDPYPVGFITTNPILIGPGGEYSFYGYELYVEDKQVTKSVVNRSVIRSSQVLFRFMQEYQSKSKK